MGCLGHGAHHDRFCPWWPGARRPPLAVRLVVVVLLAVIGQGLLGGMRVRMDEVLSAGIYGRVGPAFFGLTVALAGAERRDCGGGTSLCREIAHGDSLRRMAVADSGPGLREIGSRPRDCGTCRWALCLRNRSSSGLVSRAGGPWLWSDKRRRLAFHFAPAAPGRTAWTRPTAGLCLLVALQIALGLGTWIVKYGWPTLAGGEHLAGFVVQAESRRQARMTTAHVAVGSLILVTSLLVSLRALAVGTWRAGLARRAAAALELVAWYE